MSWVREKDHGLATAVFNGIFYGGAGIGGTFSGYMIANFGWVQSYWGLALLQLVTAIIWLFTVKEKSITVSTEEKKSNISIAEMLKKPAVWLLVIAFIATTWAVQSISVDMPLFSSYLGYGELESGKIMSAITVGIVAACIISGKASDFFAYSAKNKGVARIAIYMLGCIIMIFSVAMLLILDLSSFLIFYIAVLLFSFGASWGLGAFYCILPELFDEDILPVVTGFIGGFGDAGMTIGPIFVGIIFGVRGYWSIGWSLCIIVALFSLVACIFLIKKLRKTGKIV